MKRLGLVAALTTFACVPAVSLADIITDLANATILEEFLFNDAAGTNLTAASNNVTANLWDSDADTAAVATNGLGQLNASLKNNIEFGTNYVDNATLTSADGRILGVMEMTWDFQSTLDAAENEELRISLMQFDPRSTFVVAEWEIQREDSDTLTILGNAVGTGATDLGPFVLNGGSLTQLTKFIAVIDVNMAADEYFVHYSADGGASFTTLGAGDLDPDRNTIDSLRMTLNNDLSDDNVLIDRVYLAQLQAVPEPGTAMLLALGMIALALRRRRSGSPRTLNMRTS